MNSIRFLTVQEVIAINKDQIVMFGGIHSVRDRGLLDSAIYTPQSTFDGAFLYKDIFEMAAVYAYCIIKNHPFLDGNKRTGILTVMLFLEENHCEVTATNPQLVQLALDTATSKITKEQIALFFRKHCNLH